MKSIAILPLRKGSKGIPGKNKKKLLGRPLYQWVLGEAIFSKLDSIYVYTDDDEIIKSIQTNYSWTPKVKVWERSIESATDTASTEFGMYELAEGINFDFSTYSLLQATSPLTTYADIDKSLEKIISGEADSALSVVKTKRFIWNEDGTPANYDFYKRPRRQDFDGLRIENGAVYSINCEFYKESKNRLAGKVALIEMEEDSLIEIDELADWHIVEQVLINRLKRNKKFKKIRGLVLDVDGVFTNGNVWVSDNGELAKSFSFRDGMGFELAREHGIETIVMTSENSAAVDRRMEKLKINNYYKGVKDKYSLLTKVCQDLNLDRSELAYIGDDINDLACMLSVGWGMTPRNAVNQLKQHADIVLHANGGDKAIREGIEFIIKLNNY